MKNTEISFTRRVKFEIANQELGSNNESIAELNAFLSINGSFILKSGKKYILANTNNEYTAKRIYAIFIDLFGENIPIDLQVVHEKDSEKYQIIIDEDYGFSNQLGINQNNKEKLISTVLKDDKAFCAYFKGLFLASGSINSPETTFYHLEIATIKKEKANFIKKIINGFGNFEFKTIKRNNQWIIYVKKSEQISDFMKLIGCVNSLIEFEDVRILRDFENSLNRTNNMDVANITKAVKASAKIIKIIKTLQKKSDLAFLSDKDKQIAKLRVDKPEMNMNDLATHYSKTHNNSITKSGINHVFRKLKKEYEKYED